MAWGISNPRQTFHDMKGLSINRFWEMRPKLPFRFKAQFFTGLNGVSDETLSFCVTSITVPPMGGQASEGSLFLGDTIFTVPVWDVGYRKLEISFEETDDMLVSQFLDKLNRESYGKVPWRITVVVHEFEEHMRDSNAKAYVCHLTSYDEPSFKRDGAAAQVTLNATFIVDVVMENWNEGLQVTGNKVLKADDKELNLDLDSLQTNYSNEKFKFGNANVGVTGDLLNGGTIYKYTTNTKDYDVSQEEIDLAYDKIQKSGLGNTVKKEDLAAVQNENAQRMKVAMDKFETLLNEKGYGVSVNAYNDANHAIGIGTKSGSHLLAQKIDLKFTRNGEKLTPSNMSNETVNEIVKMAKQAGLTPNWETNGSSDSGWGDFALQNAKSIDKTGRVVDLNTTSWTGETSAKNLSTNNIESIG